jgi:RNA polymerase sigma factor (sigma-70 family)
MWIVANIGVNCAKGITFRQEEFANGCPDRAVERPITMRIPMLDSELLDQYVSRGCQEAFAQIVHRYMDMVYSVARRHVCDLQTAEDVAQAVFIILAKKAGRLRGRESLGGWLVQTTYLASRDAGRSETRRKRYEQQAAQHLESQRETSMKSSSSDLWAKVDEGLARLGDGDRNMLVVRYLQEKSVVDAASALNISPAAAEKRITRALGRLRGLLVARKAIAPSASFAGMLAEIPRLQAPVALAKTAASAGTAGTNPAGLAIAKGVLHHMLWSKVAAALALFVGIGTIATAGAVGMKLLADGSEAAAPVTNNSMSDALAPQSVGGGLANGVWVGILGLHAEAYSPTGWWGANGDPLAVAPCSGMQYGPFDSKGNLACELVLQINREVQGTSEPATVQWSMRNDGGWTQRRIEGPNPLKAEGAVISVADNPQGATLEARVAAGRWKTIASSGPNGEGSTPGPLKVLIGEPFVEGGKLHIEVAFSGQSNHDDLRLIGINRVGSPVAFTRLYGAGWVGTDTASEVAEYSATVAPSSISGYQFQTRLFDQLIEIKNISLHAGQRTVPRISTSDNPGK